MIDEIHRSFRRTANLSRLPGTHVGSYNRSVLGIGMTSDYRDEPWGFAKDSDLVFVAFVRQKSPCLMRQI